MRLNCSRYYNECITTTAHRRSCSFVSKAMIAETAGALAIIVTDADSDMDTAFIEMIEDGTGR